MDEPELKIDFFFFPPPVRTKFISYTRPMCIILLYPK